MAKKKSKKSGGGKKKGGGKSGKGGQSSKSKSAANLKSKKGSAAKAEKKPDQDSAPSAKAAPKQKTDTAAKSKASAPKAKASAPAEKATPPDERPPELVNKLVMVDNGLGYIEQAFLFLVLFSLIGVGTYQFIASHIYHVNDTWPFGALRNLVFLTAMGGAALAAQKGRMISMDFVARKFSPKNRVVLRILITFFVVFTCYLLFKGGIFVRDAAEAHHDVFVPTRFTGSIVAPWINLVLDPKFTLMMLPVGAALIAVHYTLHALTDALYLSAGLIPPEEEGPAAH